MRIRNPLKCFSATSSRIYEIIGASDGLDGYALAVAHRPAAIVIDILMPIVDGWTVMVKVRSNPATRLTPILIATALARDAVLPEATRLGVQSVLRKPLVLSELTRELDRFTSLQQSGGKS